ncbi:hypothetical protein [Vreelandella aquamarina]|uniref:Uncharacterized protein n=1 Tax=Vreelandella aquamarina TaxID=77097 RepID=A0A857GIQ4_9GAMM|nr:hypothetical protein [Halomonas meridiana]QHD49153.1 hypothetical protein CTT34_05305 [Halomonas meridiana]
MTTFYSAATNSFYDTRLFGEPTHTIIDPDFEWPMVEVPDPNHQGEDDAPLIQVRDDTIEPPMITVPNPDCRLPEDAVEITEAQHQALMQNDGSKVLAPADDGYPSLVDRPPVTLGKLADQKRREINAASVEALAAVRNEYPDYEQLSWERQEREALEGGGPLIESIANARGLELSELIDRILEKSNLYQQAAGNVIGKRQALEDRIAAALKNGDRDTISSLSW